MHKIPTNTPMHAFTKSFILQKVMARSFRQILFPHIRRMVSLLKTLVEWSKQNRKDAEYRMATKALDQQFSAAVSWAAGMTGVVNAVRDLEKKHYGIRL